jgi:hypothetical protein
MINGDIRTADHYETMLAGNPTATIGFTLAADMVCAALHGTINRAEAHDGAEWQNTARALKQRYGENLSVDQVRHEMSSSKTEHANRRRDDQRH